MCVRACVRVSVSVFVSVCVCAYVVQKWTLAHFSANADRPHQLLQKAGLHTQSCHGLSLPKDIIQLSIDYTWYMYNLRGHPGAALYVRYDRASR